MTTPHTHPYQLTATPSASSSIRQHASWSPYDDNGGTVVAVAGDTYCIVAASTRLSTGYSILTRNQTKVLRLSDTCMIASAGMQADRQALHKMLHTRHVQYQFSHRKSMSANAVAQLLSTTLYHKRFFPYYTFNLCCGLDEEGRGAIYSYDAIGSFERVGFGCQGSGKDLIQPVLEQAVSRMQNIILLGRQKREQVKIKTKIPLSTLTVIHESQDMLDEISRLEDYIAGELNVKSVVYTTEEDQYINLFAKPNSPVLGKRFGKAFNQYRMAIQDLDAKALNQLQEDGSLVIDGESFSTDDILVFREAKEGTQALSNRFISIDMDCELNDDLIDEGLAREVINRIQKTRKDIGLNVTDRISITYNADERLASAIEKHRDYIAGETLCNTFTAASASTHSFDVDGNALTLDIQKSDN